MQLFLWHACVCLLAILARTETSRNRISDAFLMFKTVLVDPFDAGTLLYLSVGSFCERHRTKLLICFNDEHAIRGQVNGSGFERRAKRRACKDVSPCYRACSDTQTHISALGNAHGSGKHRCRICCGRAFLRMLWCGQAYGYGSSLTRLVSISLPRA
jgi:hypothetical protein